MDHQHNPCNNTERPGSRASTSPHHATMAMASRPTDDSFELYDLRVEVVCPPGEKIMCGARNGDYFTLEGEMMYLPPGQGISIYSLGEPTACVGTGAVSRA